MYFYFWLAVILPIIVFLLAASPYLDAYGATERAVHSEEYKSFLKTIPNGPNSLGGTFTYDVSALIRIAIPVFPADGQLQHGFGQVAFRYDRIALFGGSWIVFLLLLFTLGPNLWARHVASVGNASDGLGTLPDTQDKTAALLFEIEVARSHARADILFNRSTLLLAGGIVMAFIGVIVFYLTLPETTPAAGKSITDATATVSQGATAVSHAASDASILSNYALHAIRPTGVLIFLEAIAWFLLRQYRALIEDYKSFYRIYMKRTNYLAVLYLLKSVKVRKEDLVLITALLKEDLSGKLGKDETTETVQRLTQAEDSPVTEIIRSLGATALHLKEGSSNIKPRRRQKTRSPLPPDLGSRKLAEESQCKSRTVRYVR
jgi:hypothetical protein